MSLFSQCYDWLLIHVEDFISVWNFKGILYKPDPWTFNTGGVSDCWVLLQVVSEDSKFVVFSVYSEKITSFLELAKTLIVSIKFYVILFSFLGIQSLIFMCSNKNRSFFNERAN